MLESVPPDDRIGVKTAWVTHVTDARLMSQRLGGLDGWTALALTAPANERYSLLDAVENYECGDDNDGLYTA
jgi:hypothetical protein